MKELVGRLFGWAIALIIVSAMLALVTWFFADVVFWSDLGYTGSWRWTFIVLAVLLVGALVRNMIHEYRISRTLAAKWNTSVKVVLHARNVLNLSKEKDWQNWDASTFHNWFRNAQSTHEIAEKVRKHRQRVTVRRVERSS